MNCEAREDALGQKCSCGGTSLKSCVWGGQKKLGFVSSNKGENGSTSSVGKRKMPHLRVAVGATTDFVAPRVQSVFFFKRYPRHVFRVVIRDASGDLDQGLAVVDV